MGRRSFGFGTAQTADLSRLEYVANTPSALLLGGKSLRLLPCLRWASS